jgi:PAS domain S-box-containing protein
MRIPSSLRSASTSGLVVRLLIAGAVTPFASDEVVRFGARIGLYGTAAVALLHGVLISVVFSGVAVAEGIARSRSDRACQQALDQAWKSEERLRLQLDRMPIACINFSSDLTVQAWNRAAERIFGYSEREMVGRSFVPILRHGLSQEILKVWQEVLDGREPASRVHDAVGKDGRTIICRWTFARLLDSNGEVSSVLAMAEDITAKRHALETLASNETRHHEELKAAEAAARRLLHAVEQLDEVVFTTDGSGAITYVNPAFTHVYGFTRDEAIGSTPRLIKGGEKDNAWYAEFWGELLAGRSVRAEYRNRARDGRSVDVVASASPILESDGQIGGFIAVQRDVTEQHRRDVERQRMEERLGQIARMESLGTLAGGIAHDFNNILSIILTHASLLERRHDDAVVAARVTSTIKQAVQRGAALARQILTFARRAEVKSGPVDLTHMLMELGSMMSATLPRTIHVTLDLDPDVPIVSADAAQVHQCLLNLCVNARDAMDDGGELTLSARRISAEETRGLFAEAADLDHVVIAVRDTGCGIDEETRKRMFEPFYTTKEKGKGTGLGLAVVHGVVTNHGGSIDVVSQPGQGTTFRIFLPVHVCETKSKALAS